jgi:hypothetical protein
MNMRTATGFFLSIALILALPLISIAQDAKFMPADQIRPGMKGVGRTVFQGTTIEEFQVEILGVLKNYGPKQDMILARLSGGPLERTGVIQGMSGSPVYIDGRLIGAVAFAFPLSKDPVAGIQPIAQMFNLLAERQPEQPAQPKAASSMPAESPAVFIHNLMEKVQQGAPLREVLSPASSAPFSSNATLTRIQTPLFVSGASPAAIQQFSSLFSELGFATVQSGGAGSALTVAGQPARQLQPGSPVNAEMVRGDISVSANGTVTYVDGNKIYAFGHPFLSAGPTNLPMSNAYVISVLPKLDVSSKFAVPMDVIGAFQQDRATGIFGTIGDKPDMIPVTVRVKSSLNTTNQYNFEVANNRFLTPALMNFTVFSAITASERELGEMTLNVSGQVLLKDHDPLNIATVFTGDVNGPTTAAIATVAPIQYLMTSGNTGAVIQKIDLEIVSTDRKVAAVLDHITVDRNEVRPGDTIKLSAFLRATNGDAFVEQYPVQVPAGLSTGPVQLLVGDGNTVTTSELKRGAAAGAPADLKAAIRELNKLRRNDRLYIKILSNEPGLVIGGEELPSLPPSMVALLDTDRTSSRSVTPMQNSTVREYELPQSKYVIQGQRSLTITVKP